MKTFWKKHIVISLFLPEIHLLVSSAVMSSPQDLIGASAASVLSLSFQVVVPYADDDDDDDDD